MSATGFAINGAEIFSAGTHRGEQYSVADLDDMVRNFTSARGVVDPPLVVGHEEEQPLVSGKALSYLENTGIPAVGWITRIWRKGMKLFADFTNIPEQIARVIQQGAYRKVSSEVYDEPPEGVPSTCKGKMLRRVALLGGELPQIKTLADLPPLKPQADLPQHKHFCETRTVKAWTLGKPGVQVVRKAKCVAIFSEVKPMDRGQLEEQLKGVGFSDAEVEALKGLPDDAFSQFVLACLARQAGGAAVPETPEVTDNADVPAATDMPMDPEAMIAELVAMGEDEAALRAMTPEDLMALYQQKKGATMAAQQPAATVQQPASPAPVARQQVPAMPNQQPTQVVLKYSDQQREAQAKALEKRLAELEATIARRQVEEKRLEIKAFCERQVQAGKLLPAEIEGGVIEIAMRLDASKVRKFSDGHQGTDLDAWKRSIEKRPVLVQFSERLKGGGLNGGTPDQDLERVKRFSEQPQIAAALKAAGKTSAKYVADYQAIKAKKPDLTPEQYGVSA